MGPVERVVRAAYQPPVRLVTAARGAPFVLKAIRRDGLVILLGRQEAHTPITWECLEGVPNFLRGRGWVRIGSRFETDADPGTLDEYMKGCIKRATAGWIAAFLEGAGVVEIFRGRPTRVRLRPGY